MNVNVGRVLHNVGVGNPSSSAVMFLHISLILELWNETLNSLQLVLKMAAFPFLYESEMITRMFLFKSSYLLTSQIFNKSRHTKTEILLSPERKKRFIKKGSFVEGKTNNSFRLDLDFFI